MAPDAPGRQAALVLGPDTSPAPSAGVKRTLAPVGWGSVVKTEHRGRGGGRRPRGQEGTWRPLPQGPSFFGTCCAVLLAKGLGSHLPAQTWEKLASGDFS